MITSVEGAESQNQTLSIHSNIRHGCQATVKGGSGMARMEISAEQIELGAQTGAPDALFELGMLYATGREVAADLVVAHKWFNLAAARGNEGARAHRTELAREMSADQVAEAQKLAREWLQTH
jgi:TPR repeat protein